MTGVGTAEKRVADVRTMRVDQVGSLLRPQRLKAAFEEYAAGDLSEAELKCEQDEAIEAAVARQVELGLPVVTDGEYRRNHFMESFADVAGMENWTSGWTIQRDDDADESEGGKHSVVVRRPPIAQRLRLLRNKPREEYSFVAALTDRRVKVPLLGPDRISLGFAADDPDAAYATVEEFLDDVVAVEREIIAGLIEAGADYIHIDEPGFTSYLDDAACEAMRARGEDPAENMARSIRANNAVIADFPGVTFGVHLCRGNSQSRWHREGSYDSIAERLFNDLGYGRLLLEYDTERAGGFEPLRFLPKGRVAVLGLVTTKSGTLETLDELQRRVEEASRYLPLEQLALSPQCGFASDITGNLLSEDEQWRKLELIVEAASKIWG